MKTNSLCPDAVRCHVVWRDGEELLLAETGAGTGRLHVVAAMLWEAVPGGRGDGHRVSGLQAGAVTPPAQF